jgi:two-component system phosphate regulon sensor histidine kinase PhoR
MESELTRSLLAAVPIPVVLIGPDERIAGISGAAAALLGDGLIGRHYIMAMRQPALLEVIEATLRFRQAGTVRLVVTGPAREQTFRVTVTPVTGDGRGGILAAFEDITELEQAGQMRRDFVANVSHELRTPLTALLGFIETLKGAARDDPAARERFLNIMEREAERMNRLVRDLLSLSRVEAEERVRPTTRIDIVALIGQTAAALRQMTDGAAVSLTITGETGPVIIAADADRLLAELSVKLNAAAPDETTEAQDADPPTGHPPDTAAGVPRP